ncbi:Na+/H+ antiporter [Pseudobacillus sp. 179-B 2D1 NHS]|uniref:Na+/H+ antiporter n=1 Tax=Pseudobacillus sp. 179-B 2D1 NHS TaxID=3374292 RepID=UPI0038792997
MEFFLVVLLLLAVIGFSNVLNHFIPFVPVPLVQVALGATIVAFLPNLHIPMEPELFFVLFIAPLLFNDGRNVPRAALWKMRNQILLLALGLVFVTVFAIGGFIHWLIPSIPLPAAFALAAILSPTDVVAVGAVSSRVSLNKRIMHLLEGEGLMNDASGLVAFKFAVAATVTGVFSLGEAVWSFLVIAIGGFAIGAVLAFAVIRLRVFIRRLGMEDVTVHMLIQILTPFLIYLAAEHVHVSGILAVVAAGIVHAIERDREQSPAVQLQVVSKSTWTVILYILNGLVFVLLGLQVPLVLNEIFQSPLFNNVKVITYILLIGSALFLLRFIWVYFSWWGGWTLRKQQVERPSLRSVGIVTISGVRGAVTLAGAFTIPYTLADGSPFPERALIVFIAAGVILMTLTTASIVLPILAKPVREKGEENKEKLEKSAFIQTQKAAIRAIREVIDEENREAALAVIATYNRTISELIFESDETDSSEWEKEKADTRLRALGAEAQYLGKLIKEKRISKEMAYLLQEYIHRREIAVINRLRYKMLIFWTLLRRSVLQLIQVLLPGSQERRKRQRTKYKKMLELKIEMVEYAVEVLKNEMNANNKNVSFLVMGEYNQLLAKLKLIRNNGTSKNFTRLGRELQVKAFQAERDEVQSLYERGKITLDITRKIRQQINIRETYWIGENNLNV